MASPQNDFDPMWFKAGQWILGAMWGVLLALIGLIYKGQTARVEKLEAWRENHDREANGRIDMIRAELHSAARENNHTFDKLFDELKEDREKTGDAILRIEKKLAALVERSGNKRGMGDSGA